MVCLFFCLSAGLLRAQDRRSTPRTDSTSVVKRVPPQTDGRRKTAQETALPPSSGLAGQDSAKVQDTPAAARPRRSREDTAAVNPPAASGREHPPASGTTVQAPVAAAPLPSYPTFVGRSFDRPTVFADYLLAHNRFFDDSLPPEKQLMPLGIRQGREASHRSLLFYLLLGVCFLLALIRMGFSKYFQDLFQAFISPTLSQRQLKDQLYQTPFPAFALNVFFSLSAGIYLYLVLLRTGYIPDEDPLYLAALFVVFLMFSYSFKYVILRLCGWLFGYYELMDNYIFTLFLINKILGVVLLPFVLLLAFSTPGWSNAALHISIVLVAILFIYRYIRVFPLIKSQIAFSKFFFLLYICAFEIAPILIIGKLTLLWLKGT